MEPLFVANNLDGNQDTSLVIDASHHLPEASLSKHIDDLIPIREVVAWHNCVVATLIVVSEVGTIRLHIANNLRGVLGAAEVDILVIYDLTPLVDVEHSNPDRFLRADTLLSRGTLPKCVECPSRQLRLFAP